MKARRPPLNVPVVRCRTNTRYVTQSRPDYGLGVDVKVRKLFKLPPLRTESEVQYISIDVPGEMN